MARLKKFITIIAILFSAAVTYASGRVDTASSQLKTVCRDTARQRDLMDLVHSMLRSGSSQKNNSVGSKPVVSMVPAVGYAMQSRMAVLLSGNMAFRTGPQARISVINFSTSYTQNAQFTLPLLWNIWSKNNDYNFVGDMRFYAYPQSTYGLGSNSDSWQQDPMDYNYFRISETVLRHVAGNLYLGAGYVMDNHWGISHQTPIAIGLTGFSNYNTATHTVSSAFTLNGVYDSRDNSINSSHGFYAMYQFRENLPVLGSTSAWNSLVLDVRKYVRFPANSNNVLAFWSYDWLTLSGAPPYLDLPSTLWDANTNAGRGYIQGRFRGAQMLYAETEYRYRITRDGLVGGVFFVNAQSFSAAPGTRLQAIQPGYGPGLRFKLNKVSKTNISVDYGFGAQGSHGVFVNVGELF